jgi:hypothetical protein
MPVLSTMGLKAFYYAPINSSDPKAMPTTGWKSLDVYMDTCTFVDKDPTITIHKSETSSKKIIQKTKEGSELKLSLMDPSIDEMVVFEGGTKATTGSGDTAETVYTEPSSARNIELAFKILPEAGLALNIPCASVSAKKNTTYSAKGITLLELSIEPTYAVSYSNDVSDPTVTA